MHCVLAGSSGTHAVCVPVCAHRYHQTPTLLLAALDLSRVTCEDLIGRAVCDLNNRGCITHGCDKCPGEEGVINYLKMLVYDDEGDDECDDVEIRYKKWESTSLN